MVKGPVPADGVSVVIPAFQSQGTLEAALRSVLEQSGPVEEIIVVDDGSTDATAAVAGSFVAAGSPVNLLRLTTNSGVAVALNAGISAATMPILMLLDADDLWAPGKVVAQRAVLAAEPDVGCVFGWTSQFHDPALTVRDAAAAALLAAPAQSGAAKSSMAVRREAFLEVGYFDASYRRGDLVEWLSRLHRSTVAVRTLERVVHYRRLHTANLGTRERTEQRDEYAAVMRDISRRRRAGNS